MISALTAISWVWWLVGTFGVVGTGLMLWLAPAALVKIASVVLNFFITNRWGNMLGVGLIVFFVADVNRSLRDEQAYKEKTAAFEQEQKARDDRIAKETRDQVWTEIANATAANAATDKQVEDFTNALPPVPFADSNPFRVGNDACKLRALAGQPGCGPQSVPRRMQKAGAPAKPEGDHGGFGLPASLGRIFGGDHKDPGRPSSP